MGEHKLIYLLDHLEVLLKDLPLVDQTLRYFPRQVLLLLDQIAYFHFDIIDISLIFLQQCRQ